MENHILMIGDSAGLIHPLCGNGMAMAIHSAKIASECLIEYTRTSRKREQLEKEYTKQWKRTFATRMRNGSLIQRGLHNATITRLGVSILQKSPKLLSSVIQSTHGNLII